MKRNSALRLFVLAVVGASLLAFSNDFTGFLTRTGQFQLGNIVPTIDYVYMNNQLASATPGDVMIYPLENSSVNVTLKVQITDDNGNCNDFTENNGTAYICNGTVTVCDSTNALYNATLNYNTTDGQWGSGNVYCNMSGVIEDVQFYEINGTWTINVTLNDGINESTPLARNWTYDDLAAFSYATGGTVDMGIVTVGQWNNGTGQEEVRNTGNIALNLTWNATNFTGQVHSQQLNITGHNYVIDDDPSGEDDTTNLTQVYIHNVSTVQVNFFPDDGLVRCNSTACINENSTLEVYWHIDIPTGLAEDTYQNTIEVQSWYY